MNQENARPGVGRAVIGIVLGALLALVAPLLLMVEIFVPMTVVAWSAVALIALHRWAGRGPALACAVLTIFSAAFLTGGTFMMITLFLAVLPPMIVLRVQDRPFFTQLRIAIVAFGVGVIAAVAALYLSYGANMIQRVFGQVPAMVRALPQETIAPMLDYMSEALGRPISANDFYELYDSLIAEMVPFYQAHMPERLFGGALLSALLCAWLSNRMRARRGEAAPGSYMPLREWALPASTTGGLLLLLIVSWLLTLTSMRGAETVYYAVYGIASVAFGAQALGSAARRLRMSSLRPGGQRAALIAIGLLGTLWLPDALMVYGGASAVFGSRGVYQQRMKNRNDDGQFGGEE